MDLITRIKKIQKNTLKKISDEAGSGETFWIPYYSSIIQKTEGLLARLEKLKSEIDGLEEEIRIQESKDSSPDYEAQRQFKTKVIDNGMSPRMKGEIRRNEFIKHLQSVGINLIQRSGSLFETQSRGLVGIAYASERQPDRWFLGLPSKDYGSVVLLCENEKGEILNFVFPAAFYQNHKGKFSKVKGQLKFNIVLRGGRYQMPIPRSGNVTINEFQDNYAPLKQ